ncbi:arginine--tRNA ligase [Haliea sp. AH-315-K21]|uniref:Arginine--tRNA ligase n=1 Tax=SAR86 cluster bacterium TaxID=2030880 RepID=A0A2A5CFK7_9GAMM|nr:arginine--tRNA ligase [Haliea sp. AH-315-K21]MBN4075207.1 arginine--tRNA ligase [Gammaproteobacteria bacterium AH-315-E17]PCJ42156.1 MAG: arginine--tRNA ligase [SAR86 cluster bacterium]
MNLKQTLDQKISLVLSDISGTSDCQALVNHSKSTQFGDYQANGVMALAKRLKQNPRELAEKVSAKLDLNEFAEKVEIAGPGFINIFISNEFISQQVNALDKTQLVVKTQNAQTIVIDYSSPNLAKEMHVGHLRGTIIGDAIARTFEWMGHKLIRQNHFGDWGTQFGMLITHMLEQDDATTELSNLEAFYRASKQRFDNDPDFATRARGNVVKLQSGDEQCLQLWKSFIDVSIQHCQEIYQKLNITLTETDVVPESFYNNKLAGILESLDKQGLLTQSDGARCVFLDAFKNKEGEPLPTIVQKSDGGYLYATTDLAGIEYRCQTLHANRVLYVVDARQGLHFQQVFTVAKLAGFADKECSLEHLSYGTMMGKDGKPFKTRSGDTIKLRDLLGEGIERAYSQVEEKNPDLSEKEKQKIANVVGISAIKYADLAKNRNSDYIFDWDSMLSFEGNTAPYMLYAYARIHSIFRRAELDIDADYRIIVESPEEKELALKLLQFTEVVDALLEECYPNQLCLYLYELAGIFMSFYEACPVLKSEGQVKQSRLGLCQLTALTLKQGLTLLGIETLKKM